MVEDFIEKGGKYVVTGAIEEGVDVQMYITKNGHMATAYPII